MKSLQEHNTRLIKVLEIDGKKDSLCLEYLNWSKELAVFTAIDLRKPAYAGRFSVDSSTSEGATVIHYQRLDSATSLKDVWIHQQNDTITSIVFVVKEHNQLQESEKKLVFNAGRGFEVSGIQSIKFNGSFNFLVKGYFIQPNVDQ